MSDWTGNSKSIYTPLGASNHVDDEREENDFYATDPDAINFLIFEGGAKLNSKIWECACGQGHLSKRLEELGYDVKSTDLINRGYGEIQDFLQTTEKWHGDIVTNPPYKYAKEFVEHALDIIDDGHKVYMFLKLQFLEGQARRKLFNRGELKKVYIFSKRIVCAKNGDFESIRSSAVAYAWYEFEKGYKGQPTMSWIN